MLALLRSLARPALQVLPRALAVLLVAAPVLLFLLAIQGGSERRLLVPGPTSSGHHQIEDRCESCHTPFGGVAESSCKRCHQAALDRQNDSHAPSKFDDPGRAAQLAHVDARSCLSCHREHRPEARQRGSVSVPADFCVPCHQEVRQTRPSHRDLADSSCADVGCHNYHDNRHLHRDLLVKSRRQPPHQPRQMPALSLTVPLPAPQALGREEADLTVASGGPAVPAAAFARAVSDWTASAHAAAGVNCSGCHPGDPAPADWKVPIDTCGSCHEGERAGFVEGKHGMRLPEGLGPLQPAMARAPMKSEAHGRQLDCNSCHGSHRYDTVPAAVEACEGCHDDEHTRSFRGSPHFVLWQAERSGRAVPGTGVSCASCHLPRRQDRGRDGLLAVRAVHNQNDNLRPPDRMAREVCGQCHGLPYSLAALADRASVARNFRGPPGPVRTAMDLVPIEPRSGPKGERAP